MATFVLRPAAAADGSDILRRIEELAKYEYMEEQVVLPGKGPLEDGFRGHRFPHCLVAEVPKEQLTPEAAPLIRPLAWELPYISDVALKRPKKKDCQERKQKRQVKDELEEFPSWRSG
uniref:Uncharacterized protein n=1 Tax=Sus scrofa TaxID=9823 RepID=A0A8D0IZF5_PIG